MIVTITDLERYLQATIPNSERPAAQQALEAATAVAQTYTRHVFTGLEPGWHAARAIIIRVAARAFQNPNLQRSYQGPEGLNAFPSVSEQLLTQQEQMMLDMFRDDIGFA